MSTFLFFITIFAIIPYSNTISCTCATNGATCVIVRDGCGGKYPYASCVQPQPPFSYGCGNCGCWSGLAGMSKNQSDIDCTCSRYEGEGCLYDCECCGIMTCSWQHGFVCGNYGNKNTNTIPAELPGSKLKLVNFTNKKITTNDEVNTKIFTWPNPWVVNNIATLSKMNLHLNSDGTFVFNFWLDSSWRTDCIPEDGCQHPYLVAVFNNVNGATIDSRPAGYLASCSHNIHENPGKYDPNEFELVHSVQIHVTSSRGFFC